MKALIKTKLHVYNYIHIFINAINNDVIIILLTASNKLH